MTSDPLIISNTLKTSPNTQSGELFGDDEEEEEKLIKMMQGMMSSLLSKDVLYPSLKELCKPVSHCLNTALRLGIGTIINENNRYNFSEIQNYR